MDSTHSLLACVVFGFATGTGALLFPQGIAAVTGAVFTQAATIEPNIVEPGTIKLFKRAGTGWNPPSTLSLSERAGYRVAPYSDRQLQHAELDPKEPWDRFDGLLGTTSPELYYEYTRPSYEPWKKTAAVSGIVTTKSAATKPERSLLKRAGSLVVPETHRQPRRKHVSVQPWVNFDMEDPGTRHFKNHDYIRPENRHWRQTVCDTVHGDCTQAKVRMIRGSPDATPANGVPARSYYAEVLGMDHRFMGAFKKIHVFQDGNFAPVPPEPLDFVGKMLKPGNSQLPSLIEERKKLVAYRKDKKETTDYWRNHPLGPNVPVGWWKDSQGVWHDGNGAPDPLSPLERLRPYGRS